MQKFLVEVFEFDVAKDQDGNTSAEAPSVLVKSRIRAIRGKGYPSNIGRIFLGPLFTRNSRDFSAF
jgi:hypothetical protein